MKKNENNLDLPSDLEIRLAIEKNLIEKVKYYPSLLDGMEVSDRLDAVGVQIMDLAMMPPYRVLLPISERYL